MEGVEGGRAEQNRERVRAPGVRAPYITDPGRSPARLPRERHERVARPGPLNRPFVIARVFGIDLKIHPWLVWLLGLFLLMRFAEDPTSVLPFVVVMLLGAVIVLLHELGHSLVAQHFGVKVVDITLWPLGGMARMAEIPQDSRIEGLIAIAGPAVNYVLALLALPLLVLAQGGALIPPAGVEPGLAARVLLTFLAANLILGTFNLLPAFPMDGGRILRAWLARKGDWLGATEMAVRLGRFVALALVVASFALGAPCVMSLVALFILWAGYQELLVMRRKYGVSPFGFARAGANPFLGFGGGRGFARRPPEPPDAGPPGEPPAEPRRAAAEFDGFPGSGGISDEDVRRLERFQGRLRRPRKG